MASRIVNLSSLEQAYHHYIRDLERIEVLLSEINSMELGHSKVLTEGLAVLIRMVPFSHRLDYQNGIVDRSKDAQAIRRAAAMFGQGHLELLERRWILLRDQIRIMSYWENPTRDF